MCKERYISPFTDFGFKRLFGTETNKDILIHFLNSVIEDESPIVDLTYLNTEKLGMRPSERRAVFDLYCRLSNGSHIIVEMQRGSQEYFIDRTIFYSARAIDDAAKKGDWDFNLPKVYTIALLNFESKEFQAETAYMHTVRLCELPTGRIFSQKLTYIFIELPKFNKTIDELETLTEKWMYVIKNLYLFDKYPEKLKETIFHRFFEEARISAFTDEEKFAYEESLKEMRDYNNTLATAKKEGKMERNLEVAANLKAMGLNADQIAKATGLSPEEIAIL